MVIIAFSNKTSKIVPRIFCRHFRHCAPIIRDKKNLVMYQFVKHGNVVQINLHPRDINILRAHGWEFVYVPNDIKTDFNPTSAYSCVDLSKRALGIHNHFIQTPYTLYKHIVLK